MPPTTARVSPRPARGGCGIRLRRRPAGQPATSAGDDEEHHDGHDVAPVGDRQHMRGVKKKFGRREPPRRPASAGTSPPTAATATPAGGKQQKNREADTPHRSRAARRVRKRGSRGWRASNPPVEARVTAPVSARRRAPTRRPATSTASTAVARSHGRRSPDGGAPPFIDRAVEGARPTGPRGAEHQLRRMLRPGQPDEWLPPHRCPRPRGTCRRAREQPPERVETTVARPRWRATTARMDADQLAAARWPCAPPATNPSPPGAPVIATTTRSRESQLPIPCSSRYSPPAPRPPGRPPTSGRAPGAHRGCPRRK